MRSLICIPNNNYARVIPIFGTKYSRVDQRNFCGRQPLKNLKGYGLLKKTISLQMNFLKFGNSEIYAYKHFDKFELAELLSIDLFYIHN